MEDEKVIYIGRNYVEYEFNSLEEMFEWVKINEPENYEFIFWLECVRYDYDRSE